MGENEHGRPGVRKGLGFRGPQIIGIDDVYLVWLSAFLVACAVGVFLQGRLIYRRARYGPGEEPTSNPRIVPLTANVSGKRYVAYLLPPRENPHATPRAVWFVFGGNASLAAYWASFFLDFPDPRTAFLLFEYPGYGVNPSAPSPTRTRRLALALLEACASSLNIEGKVLDERLFLFGHSLGAAAALDLAALRNPRGIILLAPFTSMKEMAGLRVGRILSAFLLHRYDNRRSLIAVRRYARPPAVTILHGARDEIVPVKMARSLANDFAGWVRYMEIEDAGHSDFISGRKEWLLALMLEMMDRRPSAMDGDDPMTGRNNTRYDA